PGAIEATLMHQHLQKDEIIAPGREETAAAAPELTPRGVGARYRLQCSVGLPLVCADESGLLRGRNDVISVGHPERSKNLLVEIDFERFPADGFDRSSDPVDVDPVFPAITRVEYQRLPKRSELPGTRRRSAADFDIADQ